MTETHGPGDEQTQLWNGSAGRAWVDTQEVLDRLFKPFEDVLVEAVSARSPEAVLDVGCGTGATTLAVARRLAPHARCLGVDISEPMIALARRRAEAAGAPVTFVCANAQTHLFEPASVDAMMSRFGVMFFDDPVRAFANLRSAARNGAEMRFIAWRSAADNPFMTTAERAAASLLPDMPPRQPNAPGQFAFADRDRVHVILTESGWSGIDIAPLDVACSLPHSDLNRYLSRLGPVGMLLEQADDETRARVMDVVGPAFDPFVQGADVRFTAACWMIRARHVAR